MTDITRHAYQTSYCGGVPCLVCNGEPDDPRHNVGGRPEPEPTTASKEDAFYGSGSRHMDYPPAKPEPDDPDPFRPVGQFHVHVGDRYVSVSPYIEQAVALADEAAAWFPAGLEVVVLDSIGNRVYRTTAHHDCGKGDYCPQFAYQYRPSFGATAEERFSGVPHRMGGREQGVKHSEARIGANLDRAHAFADRCQRGHRWHGQYAATIPSTGVMLGHPDQVGCWGYVYQDERALGIPNRGTSS